MNSSEVKKIYNDLLKELKLTTQDLVLFPFTALAHMQFYRTLLIASMYVPKETYDQLRKTHPIIITRFGVAIQHSYTVHLYPHKQEIMTTTYEGITIPSIQSLIKYKESLSVENPFVKRVDHKRDIMEIVKLKQMLPGGGS